MLTAFESGALGGDFLHEADDVFEIVQTLFERGDLIDVDGLTEAGQS